jgi:hypothetical protein
MKNKIKTNKRIKCRYNNNIIEISTRDFLNLLYNRRKRSKKCKKN